MPMLCQICGYDQNPDGSEFCDACGAELEPNDTVNTINPTPSTTQKSSETEPLTSPILTKPDPILTTSPSPTTVKARLISKQPNAPIPEFPINSNTVIGIFDPDSGPVDIDVENYQGSETVSRNHAEIYPENGVWKIKDLGSLNGVFIKPVGQTRFNARITTPTTLNYGDEIAIAKVCFIFQNF